jgi:hypothetical protein
VHSNAQKALETTFNALPNDFPFELTSSIEKAVERRLKQLE